MKTPEVISILDLRERVFVSISSLISALESGRWQGSIGTTAWWSYGTLRSVALLVSLPHTLTACSVVPEHILTNTGRREALPAAFS